MRLFYSTLHDETWLKKWDVKWANKTFLVNFFFFKVNFLNVFIVTFQFRIFFYGEKTVLKLILNLDVYLSSTA